MSNINQLVQRFDIGEVRFKRGAHADDKSPHGYMIEHRRPDAPELRCTISLALCGREECGGSRAHVIEQADPLTISPSLVCVACGWHVLIRDGAIQVASKKTPATWLADARDSPMRGET